VDANTTNSTPEKLRMTLVLRRSVRRVRTPSVASLAACIFACATCPAGAQDTAAPRVHRSATAITLDGRFLEPAWQQADSITSLTQRDPAEGMPASERTVVRFLATPQGLAVGLWAYDREPSAIRGTQLRRDADLSADDQFSIVIDAQRDKRSGFIFTINPNGALTDSELLTFESENVSWDGIWDARTQITSEGWFAEILIPWSTLRYRRTDDTFGVNLRRFIRRKNEEVLWRGFRRTEGIRFLEREGQIVGLTDLPARARVELRPFVLTEGRLAARAADESTNDSIVAPAAGDARVGLDAKFGITPTLTLDVTTNTDFAQAEVDRQIVNLTRFPLFFPEQRTFFTEGAGIFDFGRLRQTQLFYSRRIGLAPNGSTIPLLAGARLQGRVGAQQIGVLAVRTGGDENAFDLIGRVKRDVLGRGFVGAMGQTRSSPGDPRSASGGLDFNFPFVIRGQNLVFLGATAWNQDSAGAPVGNYSRVIVDFPNDIADIVARFDRVEAAFNPSLGFVQQRGIWRYGGQVEFTPRPHRWGIRRFDFALIDYNIVTRLDGALDNANFEVRPFGAQFERGDRLEVNLQYDRDRPGRAFELFPGTEIAAGSFDWRRVELVYEGTSAWKLIPSVVVSSGEFYDGTSTDVTLGLRYARAPHLLLGLEAVAQDFSRTGGGFSARTARLRVDYAISPRLNLTWFGQYDNESRRAAVNTRVRWTRSPGSDLYIVYNSAWPTGFERGVPWSRPLNGGIVVKYVQYLRR
jgi:hypothetical protein